MNIIKNTSLYDTKKLKGLFCHVHSQLAKYEGRLPHWSSLKIQVMDKVQGRHGSGCAYVGKVISRGEPDMWISLNKETSLERIAQLFGHELMHSYGYHHNQFRKHPLEPAYINEINNKFVKDELLSPKAFYVPKKGISYKQRCKGLAKEFWWLSIDWHSNEFVKEIEVIDYRDDCLCYEDNSIKCTCDSVFDMRMDWRATSWKKAYENAMLHILGDISI